MSNGSPEEMVEHVDWLRPIDYDILEWIRLHDDADDGFTVNPATISANIDYNNRYIANRCKLLGEAGFLDTTNGPKYSLTDLGLKLLDSDIQDSEIPAEPDD
jgi:predicted transcriptional regulator